MFSRQILDHHHYLHYTNGFVFVVLLTHPACDRTLPPPRLSLLTPGTARIQIHSSWSPETPANQSTGWWKEPIRGEFLRRTLDLCWSLQVTKPYERHGGAGGGGGAHLVRSPVFGWWENTKMPG